MNQLLRFGWLPRLGCLLLLLFGTSRTAWAQVDDYTFTASSGTFTPLVNGTQTPILLDDDAIERNIALGFNFSFDGSVSNTVAASSNGFLSFNPSALANYTNGLGNALAATEKPLIAAFWEDLSGGYTANNPVASYATSGAAGSRVFTFEWLNWSRLGGSAGAQFSMQIKLYEGSNRVEMIYRKEANALATGTASIGLAGAGSPPNFLSLSDAGASPTASSISASDLIATSPATGQVYAFVPPVLTGCPPPRSLTIGDITGNSATINFRSGAAAQSFTVTYQAAGGPVQTIPTSNSPVFLVGLAVNTTYTVTVTANCAGGVTSSTATTTFATSNGYCTNVGGSCGTYNITSVALSGTAFNATQLSCIGTANTAYTNYAAIAPNTGTILQGLPYRVAVSLATAGAAGVWIDYNQDGTFAANEFTSVITSGTNGTANIQVPLGATLGRTFMRVRSGFSTISASGACTNAFSGETKDFSLTIGAAPACLPATGLTATLTPTITEADLSFTSASGGGTYTIVYGLAGFDPLTGGTRIAPATSPTRVTGLQSGTTYDFYVVRDCGGTAGQSVYNGPVTFTTPIANDQPCGARVLPLDAVCTPVGTTTFGASATTGTGINTTSCGGFNTAPRDVWFSFTTAASGPLSRAARITVTGGPAGSVQAFSAPSCTGPFTSIGCVTSGNNNTAAGPFDLAPLVPSTTYFVRVFGYGSTDALGAFTICAAAIPNCAEPVALTADNLTGTTADLIWGSQPGAGQTFTVVYSTATAFNPASAGTRITGLTNTNTTLNGLTPSTNYCFYVQRLCNGFNGNSIYSGPVCFTTPAAAPANDEPCAAVALTGPAVAGSTAGATNSTQPGTNIGNCSPARQPNDVWYSFVAGASGAANLTVTGTAVGAVRVFSAATCAGPFTIEQCQSAGASNTGFAAPVQVTGLTPGTRYYVALSGYRFSDAAGPFTVAVAAVLGARTTAASAGLQAFPNPSNTGQVTVRLASMPTATGQVSLLNALGQRVLQVPLRLIGAEQTLGTTGLAAGVYTLRLETGGRTLTQRVVLQ